MGYIIIKSHQFTLVVVLVAVRKECVVQRTQGEKEPRARAPGAPPRPATHV
jgi:hypothetical protein